MIITENIQLTGRPDRMLCAHCFQEPGSLELQILYHQYLYGESDVEKQEVKE